MEKHKTRIFAFRNLSKSINSALDFVADSDPYGCNDRIYIDFEQSALVATNRFEVFYKHIEVACDRKNYGIAVPADIMKKIQKLIETRKLRYIDFIEKGANIDVWIDDKIHLNFEKSGWEYPKYKLDLNFDYLTQDFFFAKDVDTYQKMDYGKKTVVVLSKKGGVYINDIEQVFNCRVYEDTVFSIDTKKFDSILKNAGNSRMRLYRSKNGQIIIEYGCGSVIITPKNDNEYENASLKYVKIKEKRQDFVLCI